MLCAALPAATPVARAAAAAGLAPVASSAQVVLEAGRIAGGVTLHARRVNGSAPLGASGLALSIDGKGVPVIREGTDTWQMSWPAGTPAGAARRFEAVLAHDGIRELLSGTLPAATAGVSARTGFFADHKQMAWWVLNILVVLIAVIVISRRMG